MNIWRSIFVIKKIEIKFGNTQWKSNICRRHETNHLFYLALTKVFKNFSLNYCHRTRKMVNGPFAPGIKITPSLFCTTHDCKLLFTGGHWDNSLRVINVAKGKMVSHVVRHTDIVTCVAVDNCGMQLITGSRDTTCMTWEINYQVRLTLINQSIDRLINQLLKLYVQICLYFINDSMQGIFR